MRMVLNIHNEFPANAELLKAKQPVAIEQSIPEDFPALDHFKPALDYQGQVAKSCIHCHQIRDAARLQYRNAGKPLPLKLLYPFPSPRVLGLDLDKQTCATISQIEADSPVATAGLQVGDIVETIDGNPVASEADIRWMLHNLNAAQETIALGISREGTRKVLQVVLPKNWRSRTDLSWRPTTWDMRRMATGGMTLVPLNPTERKQAGIADGKMALRADHVGQYGHHARAKKAGFRKNDIIVSFDGHDDLHNENSLIEHAVQQMKPGDTVKISYLRGNQKRSAEFKLQ